MEVDFGLHWYSQYVEAVTGRHLDMEDFYRIADRIYNLMRAYWIREKGGWSREMDYPPERWFEEPLPGGSLKGTSLDREKYDQMLSWYYDLRGWDENGVPLKETLDGFGLKGVSGEMVGWNG